MFTNFDGTVQYSKVVTAGCNDDFNVAIYPNPNSGRFHVHGETTMSSIEIRNVLGAILLQSTIASEKIILDLSMHAKGIYFYKDETLTGASKSGKIIVR